MAPRIADELAGGMAYAHTIHQPRSRPQPWKSGSHSLWWTCSWNCPQRCIPELTREGGPVAFLTADGGHARGMAHGGRIQDYTTIEGLLSSRIEDHAQIPHIGSPKLLGHGG